MPADDNDANNKQEEQGEQEEPKGKRQGLMRRFVRLLKK